MGLRGIVRKERSLWLWRHTRIHLDRVEGLGDFLELETFDQLASAGGRKLAEMTGVLRQVAKDDLTSLFSVASRIVAVQDDKSKVSRTRRAILLIADQDEERARALAAGQHEAICTWALDLHAFGVEFGDLGTDGKDIRSRLLDVHVEAAAAGGELKPWRALHLRALLQASRVLDDVAGATAAEVDAAFDEAERLALEAGEEGGVTAGLVLRDRARWRVARNQPLRALEDYRALLKRDVKLLEIVDIRSALSVIGADSGSDTEVPAPVRRDRVTWLWTLIDRPSWVHEPSASRLEDLEAYVDAVLAVPDDVRAFEQARLTQTFAPLSDLDGETLPSDVPRIWGGLLDDPELVERLIEIRTRARAGTTPAPDDPSPQPASDQDAPEDEAGDEGETPTPVPEENPEDGP